MEDFLNRIKNLFETKDDVILAFVFGSCVKGSLTKESDVDVAILFSSEPAFSDVLKIADKISEITKREADVVVLNNASPIIKMQVLKSGIIVKKKNSAEYNNFYVRTVKEYDELKRIRKEAEENILKGRIYA